MGNFYLSFLRLKTNEKLRLTSLLKIQKSSTYTKYDSVFFISNA